jgi:hypothetical protein
MHVLCASLVAAKFIPITQSKFNRSNARACFTAVNVSYANAAAKLGIAGMSRGIAGDAARYKVRSNCIGPHAFSRMIESIPGQSEAAMAERAAKTRPDQVAQLAAFLGSDAAADISGQIFGARGNEIYLYNQPRPVRTIQRGDGWSVETLAQTIPAAWKNSFTPLERTRDVYPYDAI